jgi:hypothetical protein
MSKPRPEKPGRLWGANERNAQSPLTRRRSVHPAPNPEKPEPPWVAQADVTQVTPPTHARRRKARKSVRLKVRPGQPCAGSKLDCALTKQLCELIEDQLTLEDACTIAGVSRKAVWEWRGRGQQEENPAYVAFEAAISQALINAKHALVKRVANHTDVKGAMFILKNRYPQEFRDRVVQEVTGAEGMPLLPLNPFHVVLELNTESPPLEQKPFEVIGTDGVRRRWEGTKASPIGVVNVPSLPEPKPVVRPPSS